MKVTKEVTKLEDSAVRLAVTIAKEDIAEAYNKRLTDYAKRLQIPGFRRGHVPVKIVEQKYSEAVRQEVLADVIDEALNQIFAEEDSRDIRPLPYSQPSLENDALPAFDLDKDLSFAVKYDVFPKVDVGSLDGIEIKLPQVEISEADMDRELKAIQERNALITDRKEEEAAQDGDIVTLDYFEGDGGDPSQKRDDFVYTLGSNTSPYKFDSDITGMKKGETKTVTKTYSEDNDAFKGETKTLTITVKAIKVKTLPALDDDLAQDVSERYKTIDDLKAGIRHRLETELDRRLEDIKSRALLDALVERNPVTLPKSMINAERESRLRATAERFNMSAEELKRNLFGDRAPDDDTMKRVTGDVEKALKGRLIIEELFTKRNITVTPEDIEKEYAAIAEDASVKVDEVKAQYQDETAKEYLEDSVKERKLFDTLYKEVKITDGEKMSFEKLFENA